MSSPLELGFAGKRNTGAQRGIALTSLTPDRQFSPVLAPSTVRYVPSSSSPMKKGRGKPPGLGNKVQPKQQHTDFGPDAAAAAAGAAAGAGSVGIGFTPHVITVEEGEDVASRIMLFSQQSSRAVCILSATGEISNVTLRQPATSGGTITYEGRFELLSLSGSFMFAERVGQRSRTGGLTTTLAAPDGSVLGGSVAGLLTASTPVQVVLATFVAEEMNESRTSHPMEPFPGVPQFGSGMGLKRPRSPPSDGDGSSMNHQSPLRGIPWK